MVLVRLEKESRSKYFLAFIVFLSGTFIRFVKNFLNIMTRLLVFGLMLASPLIFAQKVGTIDSQLILSNMDEIKTVQQELQAYNSKLETDVKPQIDAYQSLIKEYQDNLKTYTEEKARLMQDSILGIENNLKRIQQNGAKLLQLKNDELMRPLYQKMSNAIRLIVQDKGYSQILTLDGNNFAYIDPKYDITQQVIDSLGIKIEPLKETGQK